MATEQKFVAKKIFPYLKKYINSCENHEKIKNIFWCERHLVLLTFSIFYFSIFLSATSTDYLFKKKTVNKNNEKRKIYTTFSKVENKKINTTIIFDLEQSSFFPLKFRLFTNSHKYFFKQNSIFSLH